MKSSKITPAKNPNSEGNEIYCGPLTVNMGALRCMLSFNCQHECNETTSWAGLAGWACWAGLGCCILYSVFCILYLVCSTQYSVCCILYSACSIQYFHYTALHYTTVQYTTLHWTTLHYTTLHYTFLFSLTLLLSSMLSLECFPLYVLPAKMQKRGGLGWLAGLAGLRYTTLHYTTLHYTTPFSSV